MKIGIAHSTMFEADGAIANPPEVACHVEDLGLDSLWVSDHLAWDTPILDSPSVLAAASAVTDHLELGFSVLQLALRPLAWAAKQIGTLQVLSEGRVHLGVGIGGHPPEEWAAANQPLDGRAERTDTALRLLPDLLAGRPTRLPGTGEVAVTLNPSASVPPVWIGGDSDAALRRTARSGDGWLPAAITLDRLAAGREQLAKLAEQQGRPVPGLGASIFASLDGHLGGMGHTALVEMMTGWGFPRETADAVALSGTPGQVAERLVAHRECGADLVVVSPFGGSWRRQCELLAEAKTMMN